MAQTTKQEKGIEFVLQMSQEKYDVLELLAKLNGRNVLEYIRQSIVNSLEEGMENHVSDMEKRERLKQALEGNKHQICMSKTIIIHGEYKTNPEQLAAIKTISKAMEIKSHVDWIQWAALSSADGDLEQLGYFETKKAMREALEE